MAIDPNTGSVFWNEAEIKALTERLEGRKAEFLANDRQFREAMPVESVSKARFQPGLSIAQILAIAMEGYADRPALAQRANRLVTDPATGRTSLSLLSEFRTISYRDLSAKIHALAAVWHRESAMRIAADDFVCIVAFAGIDYAVVDLAAVHLGAVTVPLQANAPTEQLTQIVAEVGPRCIAASLECLDAAVNTVLLGYRPASLVVFDYRPEVDEQRERFEAARRRLADAGCPVIVNTLEELCERGAALRAPPPYAAQGDENRLSTIYYTSGSTGSPKGAMYPEKMLRESLLVPSRTPLIFVHYMPMNHSFGRSAVFMTLTGGGTCYFTAKSDLSALFEDIRMVRPTQLNLVPRICEMIYQHYRGELERAGKRDNDPDAFDVALMADLRQNYLGGRILSCSFGSAPMTRELKAFTESCLDLKLLDNYGATEVSGVTLNTRIRRPPIIDYKLVDVPELGYFRTDNPYPRGELLIKTSSLMSGYYKRPDLTAAVIDQEGYYKTGDIMAEIGPDQIIYVDRRNNVLKLAQGEFVAIAKLETVFTSGHPLIRQVYLYGSSERAFLLAVVVPNMAAVAQRGQPVGEAQLKQLLRDAITKIARTENLQAYEVPRDFLVETEPFTVDNGLLAGIGKYVRPNLKARYGARLEQLYRDIAEGQENELRALRRDSRNLPVSEALARAVQATLGIEGVDPAQAHSFTELGGDSLSALSFSMLLEEIFEIEVPVGVITDPTGNLQLLAQYIETARARGADRPSVASVHGRGATKILALDLALEKFIDAQTLEKAKALAPYRANLVKTVLLTGGNGFLGRFLCLEWLERLAKVGGKLVCVTRGRDAAGARRRLAEVFDSGDPGLLRHFEGLAASHLEVLAGDISEPNLGLDEANWNRLAATADLIVHPAALVNHVLPYGQLFGPNVVGTAELIRLAITARLKRFNYVSTIAAAMIKGRSHMDEDTDVRVACPVRIINDGNYASGYASSKWAAEVLLRDAHDRFGLPVDIFRSDMILAHSRYRGQLNVPDMFTRWVYSLVATGLAPHSFYVPAPDGSRARAHYDGLPVDFSAAAIAELGVRPECGLRTYHVVNPHDDGISLDDFVGWMIAADHPIKRIDNYDDWFGRFETALRALPEKQRQQSSLALLHQLQNPSAPTEGSSIKAVRFHAAVRDIPHLSEGLIRKYLDDLRLLKLI